MAEAASEQEPVTDLEWIMGMTARAVQEFEEEDTQAEEQGCVRADARWVPVASRVEEVEQGCVRAEARWVPDSREGQGGIRPEGRLVPEPRGGEPGCHFRRAQEQWDRLVSAFTGVEVRRDELVSSEPLMPTKPKFAWLHRPVRLRPTSPKPPIPPPNPPTPMAPRMSTRVRKIPTSQLSVPRLVLPPPPRTCNGRKVPPTPPPTDPLPTRALASAPIYKSIGACYRAKRREKERKEDGGEEMDLLKRAMAEWWGEEEDEEPEEELEEVTESFWLKESVLVAEG
ncbi:MAG: hypothetical protein Q9160_000958 [Pyrenula sp. 1 TL-2023]